MTQRWAAAFIGDLRPDAVAPDYILRPKPDRRQNATGGNRRAGDDPCVSSREPVDTAAFDRGRADR
jgi:hypothetical protein